MFSHSLGRFLPVDAPVFGMMIGQSIGMLDS